MHHMFLGITQFEPESFVDGLLGIGVAGGGTSKSEGKALASRLTQMRKERNERAKLTSTAQKEQSSPQPPTDINNIGSIMGPISDIDVDMNKMELVAPRGGVGGAGGSRGKSKNKKKKKGKR